MCGPSHQVITSIFPKLTRTPKPYLAAKYAPPRRASLGSSTSPETSGGWFHAIAGNVEGVISVVSAKMRAISAKCEATVLPGQHSGNGEQQAVNELIIHDHHCAVDEVHGQKERPERAKLFIQKSVSVGKDDSRWFAADAKQVNHKPDVERQTDQAVANQNLKIGVVEVEFFLMEVADPSGKLRLHAGRVPAEYGFFQEHVAARPVHRHSEIHRTAFFQPVTE